MAEKTKTKRRVSKQTYQLVEVVPDGENNVYVPIPAPPEADMTSRTPIMRAVRAAIAAGDTTYDDKVITVISFPAPIKVTSEPVVVKRKVSFIEVE